RVCALDVGRGQLAEAQRADLRVVSMERTNARTLGPGSLLEPVSLPVVDVSFISLSKVLGPMARCFDPTTGGPIVALVKPQFEAGRGRTDHGVVRDPAIHREVLERVSADAAAEGIAPRGLIASPILGPQGNREFLICLDVRASWGPGATSASIPADWSARIAEVIGS